MLCIMGASTILKRFPVLIGDGEATFGELFGDNAHGLFPARSICEVFITFHSGTSLPAATDCSSELRRAVNCLCDSMGCSRVRANSS
mmetsp:Transcript_23482/g.62751  ORF Transcript_23482/g.62751 Transcript_23482/m.62751 type:complete len:87 (-) Transcript_23482:628-888(-)